MDYVKGMTWGWVGEKGQWQSSEAKDSMQKMTELGITHTAITFQALQQKAQSTDIMFNTGSLITDDDVKAAIEQARSLKLSIVLKPVVNVADGTWRAHINFFDLDVPCEPKWSDWFKNYEMFILHYAKIAEDYQVEMFCIGCEMVQTDRKATEWRELIRKVREVYSGLITYNCDKYQEDQVTWWDAVDVISSSGYYPAQDWHVHQKRLETFANKWGKPFFFMETGCPSRPESASIPNDWDLNKGQVDVWEQDYFYEEMFRHFHTQPWFYGFMLWDWPAELYKKEDAMKNDDYCVYGKPAAERIRSFFTHIKDKRVSK